MTVLNSLINIVHYDNKPINVSSEDFTILEFLHDCLWLFDSEMTEEQRSKYLKEYYEWSIKKREEFFKSNPK